MRTWSRCAGRVTPLFLRALLLDGKTVCGACKRAVYLCFLGCAGMRSTLLTGLSAAGLLGVAVDKVSRCVAIPALLAVWEWRKQAGVSCAAKSPVSFLLLKKDCSTWVLPSIAVLFMYMISWSSRLPVSRKFARRATVSVGNQRGNCRFPLRPSREKVEQPSPQA